eukprot:TRINITY_DN7303_c0_g5_i1.p1 TRINITY_DN7303_c0_g5~~TRINITY_DN7303_c0_g5_i1.p1  ORF type:complete len:100 (+),score=2.37 TRINITY_DN7303_c0_g5_i1:64-363(+)
MPVIVYVLYVLYVLSLSLSLSLTSQAIALSLTPPHSPPTHLGKLLQQTIVNVSLQFYMTENLDRKRVVKVVSHTWKAVLPLPLTDAENTTHPIHDFWRP